MGEGVRPTPAHHLDVLLARAQNPFDISDAVLARLRGAVMFQTELYGWRHRSTPPPSLRCSSYRHVFLLADGSSLLLWELCYDSADETETARELHEIYETEEALRASERRVHHVMSGPDGPGDLDADGLPDSPGTGHRPTAHVPFEFLAPAAGPAAGQREFSDTDSAEHARRLLRRAENRDRPGAETLRLLSSALAHQITNVPKPLGWSGERQVWCSLYEHAFLLADGRQISLYELEHNLSRTGRLVCEVYLDEAVADEAAHHRARDQGIDL